MEEIRSQGRILTRICVKESAKTFNQVEESDDELYIYPIYSEADSDHTKYLVEPQLREGERYEWTAKPCKQIIAQRPTDQLWKITKSIKNRSSLENIQAILKPTSKLVSMHVCARLSVKLTSLNGLEISKISYKLLGNKRIKFYIPVVKLLLAFLMAW